jgi:hypothetical protein
VQHNYPGCCGDTSLEWGVDAFNLAVNDISLDPIYATDSCNGSTVNVSGLFDDWWSGNTSVATVTNTAVTGVSAGATTANASGVIFLDGCFEDPVGLSNPVNVAPTVTISGSPYIPMLAQGTQGSNSTTLTANGNPAGGAYAWTAVSGQGNIAILNANSQTATIQSVAVGNFTVQAAYTVNHQQGTATAVGKVQKPGSLDVVSNDSEAYVCTDLGPAGSSYNTQERLIQYQVLDTSSPPLALQAADMTATETLTVTTNTCQVPDPTPTVGAKTGSDGYFPDPDTLRLCSSVCLPANGSGSPAGSCSLVLAQTWTVNGYLVKSDTPTFTCSGPPTGAP